MAEEKCKDAFVAEEVSEITRRVFEQEAIKKVAEAAKEKSDAERIASEVARKKSKY